MTKFNHYKAVQKLKRLAQHPFDLTADGNLSTKRLGQFSAQSNGFKLFFGTERVTEEVMRWLYELAQESHALEKMKKMQSGDVLNLIEGFNSENRSVLHTATRDFFEQPNRSKIASQAANEAKNEVDKLKKFMAKIDQKDSFTDLIVIGIGGSYLGPAANYLALQHLLKPNRRVHFISNIDPDDVTQVLKGINLNKSLVVAVSKSGSTLETATNEEVVRSIFKKQGLKPHHHFIAVTGKGSPLDDKSSYLECFYMWDWIGGRYSSTSMVGGVPLAFAFGFDVYWEFLRGANAMDKATLAKDPSKNLPLISALLGIWNRNFLNYSTLAIIPYSQALNRYPAHIQQLDMESNGKHIDQKGHPVDFETGPIIWGEPGTSAQHSFYQLIHQGTTIVPVEFIGFKLSQTKKDKKIEGTTSQEKLLANLFAQALALALGQKNDNPNKSFEGNRPSHILMAKQLTPYMLGGLLAYFEHKVAFQGFIWGINSFDQEGVQLGKVLANRIIDRFAGQKKTYPLADYFIKELNQL